MCFISVNPKDKSTNALAPWLSRAASFLPGKTWWGSPQGFLPSRVVGKWGLKVGSVQVEGRGEGSLMG